MEIFELENLSNYQKDQINNLAYQMIYEIFENENRDIDYQRVDLALKQTFKTNEVDVGVSLEDNIFNVQDGSDIVRAQINEETENETDEFSGLYTPLIYKVWKGWVTHMKEAVIPDTDDWFSIERKRTKLTTQLGLQAFLPILNKCWERNIHIENESYKIKPRIRKAIAQACAYGATPGILYYDAIENFVDLKVPHIRDFGIYPISDEWHKSVNIYRYDLNYVDAIRREDLDQNLLRQFKPWMSYDETQNDNSATPTQRSEQYEDNEAPWGKIRFHEVWIPSLFIEGNNPEDEDVLENGVMLTVAYQPQIRRNADQNILRAYGNNDVYIVKAVKDVSYKEFRNLFAAFDETLPGQPSGRGPLIPFLVFQQIQNQLISAMARDTDRNADPPLNAQSGDNDLDDTPIEEFRGGAIYEDIEITPLTIPGYENRIAAVQNFLKFTTDMVEEASGMTKLQLGGRPQSRRTKFELQEQMDSGGLRINDAAGLFDEGFIKPMLCGRLAMTTYQLKTQAEEGVKLLFALDPMMQYEISEDEAFQVVLDNNPLFQRLLMTTGIEEKYEDFYKSEVKKKQKNDGYIAQYQRVGAQLADIQQRLSAPYQKFEVPEDTDMFDRSSVDTARKQFYEVQKKNRDDLTMMQEQLLEKQEKLELMIEDLNDPIPPSDYLYYLLLTDDMNESDIVVYGSKTTLNKAVVRRAALELYDLLSKLPPDSKERREIDLSKILRPYMAAIGHSYENVKKSEEEINRAEQDMQTQMLMAQQQNAQQPQQ